MPQMPNLNDMVLMKEVVEKLEEATNKGSIKWMTEEGDTESFSARLASGAVRISWLIVGSTYLLEMLDLEGHTIASAEASPERVASANDRQTYELLQRLHRCARNQALGADDKIGALLEEIRRLAGNGSGVKG